MRNGFGFITAFPPCVSAACSDTVYVVWQGTASQLGSLQEEKEAESQQCRQVREELINAQAVTCQLNTQNSTLQQELEVCFIVDVIVFGYLFLPEKYQSFNPSPIMAEH